jgi:hypothetical protein
VSKNTFKWSFELFEVLSAKWFLSVQPGVKLGFRKINPARLAREDRSVRNIRKLLTGGGK